MDSNFIKQKMAEKSMGSGCIPKLTFKERITYFLICVIVGKYINC